MIKKINEFIDSHFNNRDIIFIAFISVLTALLRIPSVIEPYWYGDEGIYEVIGMALRNGQVLYSQIWDNKPPLLYIIYAIFNGDQFYVRLLSIITSILSIITLFMITKKIFKSNFSCYISTIFFAFFLSLPVIEGNIANAENFMILPTLIAFYILFCSKFKRIFFFTAIAGIIISLSFLTKIVAIFDFAAFAISLFCLRFYEEISFKKEKIGSEIKKIVTGFEQETVFAVAFIAPIILISVYFLINNAFPDFFRATFSQNVGYVAYGNYFFFENGLLYLKLFILLSAVMIAARYRRMLGRNGLVIFIWLFFAMFNALFSSRPYTHYLLVVLPPLSLIIGFIPDNKKLVKLTIPLVLIMIVILSQTFRINFKKVIPYYLNYIDYMSGVKSSEAYQAFFDSHTPRDYKIAEFIKAKTTRDEKVFIWGDDAQIYVLSNKLPPGRYTVSYHITFYSNAIEETKQALAKNPPKYIIQLKFGDSIENFLDGYELKYKLDDTKIYERES